MAIFTVKLNNSVNIKLTSLREDILKKYLGHCVLVKRNDWHDEQIGLILGSGVGPRNIKILLTKENRAVDWNATHFNVVHDMNNEQILEIIYGD